MRLLSAIVLSACAATSLAQVSFRGIGIGSGYSGSQLIGLSANGKVAAGNWTKDGSPYPVIEAFFSDEARLYA